MFRGQRVATCAGKRRGPKNTIKPPNKDEGNQKFQSCVVICCDTSSFRHDILLKSTKAEQRESGYISRSRANYLIVVRSLYFRSFSSLSSGSPMELALECGLISTSHSCPATVIMDVTS